MPKVLVISDLHCPYQHEAAFDALADSARSFKPDKVVCIGDEIDAAAFGRWARNPNLASPGHELKAATDALQPLYRLFPRVDVCISNHTYRPWKQGSEAGLPQQMFRGVREVISAPRGWRWRDYWEIDGVLYSHGDGFGGNTPALHAAERHRRSVVIGHVHHAFAIHWLYTRWSRIFGASTGFLGNPDAEVFTYGKYSPRRPALGHMTVADGIPQLWPLEM